MPFRRVSGYWPFGVLCAVLSARWMLADAWPGTVSSVSSEAVAAAVAGLFCFLLAFARTDSPSERRREFGRAAAAGALLFAGLHTGLLAGSESPRANDLLIALALTPAVVAVALAGRNSSGEGLSGMEVAPGILAPAGLLLILSQPKFWSVGEGIALVAAPLCAGLGAVWLCGAEDGFSWRRAAAALGGAALVFGSFCFREPRLRPTLAATALDLVVMALAVWSVARLGARRYSGQFALVPLLLLLEGLVLVRVRPGWEQVGGLAMMLVSAAMLLRRRDANAWSANLLR